jgi:hypothetical protein
MQAAFLDDALCLGLAQLLYPSVRFDRSGVTYSEQDKAFHAEFQEHLDAQFGEPSIVGRRFEAEGWDVIFQVGPADLQLVATSLPPCECGPCDHANCYESAPCQDGDGSRGCRHTDHDTRLTPDVSWIETRKRLGYQDLNRHCCTQCPWGDETKERWLLDPGARWYPSPTSGTVRVECKPDLGDDFPAVLRQVLRYDHEGSHDQRCVIVRRSAFERVTWDQVAAMFKASGITLLHEAEPLDQP